MEYFDFREKRGYVDGQHLNYFYPKYDTYFTLKGFQIVGCLDFGKKENYRYKYCLAIPSYDSYYELLKHEIVLLENFDYEEFTPMNNIFAYDSKYYINVLSKDKLSRKLKDIDVEVRRVVANEDDIFVQWKIY